MLQTSYLPFFEAIVATTYLPHLREEPRVPALAEWPMAAQGKAAIACVSCWY